MRSIAGRKLADLPSGLPAGRRAGRRARNMMYYIYILKLSNGSYYKGMTNNLVRRFEEHQTGKCYSTKRFLPCILIYSEAFSDRISAREREIFFKSGEGRELILEIDRARVAKLADAHA